MSLIILAALIALPVLLLLYLKTNSAVVFLALCAGSLLPSYVGDDARLLLSSILPGSSTTAGQITSIVLILLPAFLTAVFLRKTLVGFDSMLNIPPTAAVGLFVPLLIVPYLSVSTSSAITSTDAWHLLEQFQASIVTAGVFFSLLLLWAAFKKSHKKASKKHH